MALTATARHARVQERKKPLWPAPWQMELRGTQHWLVADSVSVAALAQGKVTSRLQVQAARVVRCLNLLEEEV